MTAITRLVTGLQMSWGRIAGKRKYRLVVVMSTEPTSLAMMTDSAILGRALVLNTLLYTSPAIKPVAAAPNVIMGAGVMPVTRQPMKL